MQRVADSKRIPQLAHCYHGMRASDLLRAPPLSSRRRLVTMKSELASFSPSGAFAEDHEGGKFVPITEAEGACRGRLGESCVPAAAGPHL